MSQLEWIAETPALRVRQQIEWTEVLTGYEMQNRYVIDDGHERFTLHAGEVSRGLSGLFWRQVLQSKRPFLVQIMATGSVVLEVVRPWRWFFSRAEVRDPRGAPIGSIQQRFAWLQRHYVLEDPHGRVLADLWGPFFKPWTFEIRERGRKLGTIRKRWSGLGKETFTGADNFSLDFSPGLDKTVRTLCMCATILIDYIHFSRKK